MHKVLKNWLVIIKFFLVKSIVNPLSHIFVTYATNGVTAFQIMPIFWKTVYYLEKTNLKVIATTADGASPKRKIFRMHKLLYDNAGNDVVCQRKNIHTSENRFIFFDTPDLIKTPGNCLFNSGSGQCTQGLSNSSGLVLWSHISRLYYEDFESGLKLVKK